MEEEAEKARAKKRRKERRNKCSKGWSWWRCKEGSTLAHGKEGERF